MEGNVGATSNSSKPATRAYLTENGENDTTVVPSTELNWDPNNFGVIKKSLGTANRVKVIESRNVKEIGDAELSKCDKDAQNVVAPLYEIQLPVTTSNYFAVLNEDELQNGGMSDELITTETEREGHNRHGS